VKGTRLNFATALRAVSLIGCSSLAVAAGAPQSAANFLVAGTVVDSQSHAPLGHVRVDLAPAAARDQKTELFTQEDGRFSFQVNAAGKYALQIARTGYPPQDYRQSGSSGVSTAIVVRDDQDTSHIVFEARKGSIVTGQIKDEESEPVPHALVAAYQSIVIGGERTVVMRSQTRANAQGEFRFRNLLRASYYVCAMGRPWFADSLLGFQAMAETQSAVFRGAAPPIPAEEAVTDDVGSESEVPLRGQPPPYSPDPSFRGTAFSTTFYPNSQTVEGASLLRTEVGSETQISITLPLTRAVSIKGFISVPGEMKDGRIFLYKKIHKTYMSFLEDWVRKDGKFNFENVPAGSYEIVATSQANSGPSSWNIQQQVEVGASSLELELKALQMGSFSGRVRLDTEIPLPTPLFVTVRSDTGRQARTEVSPDGSFSFERLPPGHYEIAAGSPEYIAAYRKDKAGTQLPLSFDIASGASVQNDLVLTSAVSMIEGTVEHEGVPQIGAFVLLLPKNPSARWAYRVDQTDSDGSFSLATIPTGDYFLVALSDGEDVAYRDAKVAAVLAKAGKPVHLDAGKQPQMKLDVIRTGTLNLPSL
jgi:hypothetical protein